MRQRDTIDVMTSVAGIVADACAVLGGFALATWARFDSGWFSLPLGRPPNLYAVYMGGAAFATLMFLVVMRSQGLYVRPQMGSFVNKVPRLVKSVGTGILLSMVLAFAVKNEADFSRLVIGLAAVSITVLIVFERWVMYRIEWNLARHSQATNQVLILGTDSVAAHLQRTFKREPMLRSKLAGFLRTDLTEPDAAIKPELIRGTVEELPALVARERVDQVVLTGAGLPHERIVDIILLCERNLIVFNMVPDLFRVLTGSMDVQSLDDIPLLGVARWPLDLFWNRAAKRVEDIVGSAVGLILSLPLIAVAAVLIKRSSPGPVFYAQERCGESGRSFNLYKLRTMCVDAEAGSGPVFTVAGDPRTTRVGAFMRGLNLDELPQFWNVLKGDMSLVGPRPERPYFVEQFKEDVGRYM